MQIREAQIRDADAIAGLAGQLGYPMSAAEAEERLAWIRAKPDHRVYVGEAACGELVGWIHVFGTQHLMEARMAEIGGLVVDERHRSAGIGQALVMAAESWARSQGYAGMRVRSNVLRKRAHAFYEGLGYHCTKTQGHFAKDLG